MVSFCRFRSDRGALGKWYAIRRQTPCKSWMLTPPASRLRVLRLDPARHPVPGLLFLTPELLLFRCGRIQERHEGRGCWPAVAPRSGSLAGISSPMNGIGVARRQGYPAALPRGLVRGVVCLEQLHQQAVGILQFVPHKLALVVDALQDTLKTLAGGLRLPVPEQLPSPPTRTQPCPRGRVPAIGHGAADIGRKTRVLSRPGDGALLRIAVHAAGRIARMALFQGTPLWVVIVGHGRTA